MATIGSATFARFELQVALQYEFGVRDIGANFSTGYIPIGAKELDQYPQAFYGTEVLELNDALRSRVMNFARDVLPVPFHTDAGGFLPSLENLALAGVLIVQGIVVEWQQGFASGIKASDYIGDIFGTLGGKPDFGPNPYFGEA